MPDFKTSFKNKTIDGKVFTKNDFPANFQGATIVNVDFSNIDIRDSDFSHAIINNCNFVGAKINTHSIITWRTRFPDDISVCCNYFDDDGIKALKRLDILNQDAKKRADIWMDRHPVRDRWTPGGKMDSPWNP